MDPGHDEAPHLAGAGLQVVRWDYSEYSFTISAGIRNPLARW